jgi:hypothetical protein
MAPPTKHSGYELDPAEVRHVVRTELEPEIDRLNEITNGLQYHGPAYFPFRDPGKPIPKVTEPLSSGTLIFGDPEQIVSPFRGFFVPDSDGTAYRQALDTLNKLFDKKFASFIDNQKALLETMRDFRQRLLDSVDAYEGTEATGSSKFNRIHSGEDPREGKK